MPFITEIYAREVLDSNGIPTVEADVFSESGAHGRAIVPSGVTKGKHEALELRDNDKDRFNSKGVLKAIENINNEIAKALLGEDVRDQAKIDNKMIKLDSTKNKSKLGANAMLAVSLACARCASDYTGQTLYQYVGGCNSVTLPIPMINIINGGLNLNTKLTISEFMIMPVSAQSFKEAIKMSLNVIESLKKLIRNKEIQYSITDKGGFSLNVEKTKDCLDLIIEAIKTSGYSEKKDINIALDVAANFIYDTKSKLYNIDGDLKTTDELVSFFKDLSSKYPIISLEDPFYEDDIAGWKKITKVLGNKVEIVGDDIFATQKDRLEKGIKGGYANSIVIKPNQVGTLTETLDTIELAKRNGYHIIISNRSGETEDNFISDLSVAVTSRRIKCGALLHTDRISKYNQLLRIEEELSSSSKYATLK